MELEIWNMVEDFILLAFVYPNLFISQFLRGFFFFFNFKLKIVIFQKIPWFAVAFPWFAVVFPAKSLC